MQSRSLAIGTITVLALIGALAWSSGDSSRPGQAPAPMVSTGNASLPNEPAAPERQTLTPHQAPTLTDLETRAEWFEGTVTDALSRPIADLEVGLLTTLEADKFRRADAIELPTAALQIERARRALMHASEQSWLKEAAILGKLFPDQLRTRTGADGTFRFRRASAAGRTTLVVWSPDLGFRFHEVTSPAAPQLIICEPWPRIRGRVTTSDGRFTKAPVVWIKRHAPILTVETDESGSYQTPPIPPASHTIEFRAEDHYAKLEAIDLIDDVTIDTELVPFAKLHTRLVDASGVAWTGQRLRTRGWNPEALRFRLVRADFENRAELDADLQSFLRPRSDLRFAPADGSLRGRVTDDQARWLSLWQRNERVTAVELPHHRVAEVAVEIPRPRPATTLHVVVSLGKQVDALPAVFMELGTMAGLGGYTFQADSKAEGPHARFRLAVPGFLRGQTCHLVVSAIGFAQQFVKVPIPERGSPEAVSVTLPPAEFNLLGKVVDENDRPLRGAQVRIATAGGQLLRVLRRGPAHRTDTAGEFRILSLARGHVRLFVARQGFASTSVLTPVERRKPVVIRMLPGTERTIDVGPAGDDGAYMLRILDAQGAPLMDDRLSGTVHSGQRVRIRLAIRAHTIEVWKPRDTRPRLTLDAR